MGDVGPASCGSTTHRRYYLGPVQCGLCVEALTVVRTYTLNSRTALLEGARTGDTIILLRDLTAKMCNKCDLEGCDRWELPDLNPRVSHSLSASLGCMPWTLKGR